MRPDDKTDYKNGNNFLKQHAKHITSPSLVLPAQLKRPDFLQSVSPSI